MSKSNTITKPELRFWMAIIGVVAAGTMAWTNLNAEVHAMQDKGVRLRAEYEASVVEMREDIKEIKENQILIMYKFEITPSGGR